MKKRTVLVPGDTLSLRLSTSIEQSVVDWLINQTSVNNSILTAIREVINIYGIKDLSPNLDNLPTSNQMLQSIFDYIATCSAKPSLRFGASVQEIYDHCAIVLGVSDAERNISSAGNTSKYENRIRWGLQKLKDNKVGLIQSNKRAYYKVTDLGRQCSQQKIDVVNLDKVMEANLVNRMI